MRGERRAQFLQQYQNVIKTRKSHLKRRGGIFGKKSKNKERTRAYNNGGLAIGYTYQMYTFIVALLFVCVKTFLSNCCKLLQTFATLERRSHEKKRRWALQKENKNIQTTMDLYTDFREQALTEAAALLNEKLSIDKGQTGS